MATYKYITNSISGIWNSYGCPPSPGESVSISLEDVPGSGSLKDLVGFNNEVTTKDIGVLSDGAEIREVIVMLPMVDVKPDQSNSYISSNLPDTQTEPVIVDPCECTDDPCGHGGYQARRDPVAVNESKPGLIKSPVEGAFLFMINPELVNKILDANYRTLDIYEIREKFKQRIPFLNFKNSIVRLMLHMLTYNFPPHLNWLLFNGRFGLEYKHPVVMYTQEMAMSFGKEDLSDIWQGVAPTQARFPEPEPDNKELEYSLSGEELLADYDLSKYPDIKMRIFKCKWHSEGEYKTLIKGSEVRKDVNKWYGYNWPYDNCSIVEYLQVQAGEVREFNQEQSSSIGVLLPPPEATGSTSYFNNNILEDVFINTPWKSWYPEDAYSPFFKKD